MPAAHAFSGSTLIPAALFTARSMVSATCIDWIRGRCLSGFRSASIAQLSWFSRSWSRQKALMMLRLWTSSAAMGRLPWVTLVPPLASEISRRCLLWIEPFHKMSTPQICSWSLLESNSVAAPTVTHTHTIGFLDMRILSFRAMAMSSVVISLQVGHELPDARGDGFGLHLRHCQEQLGRVLLQDSHKTLWKCLTHLGLQLLDLLNSSLSLLLLCSSRPWVPFITTIFLFIFVSNWSGALIPWKLFEIPAGQAHSWWNAGAALVVAIGWTGSFWHVGTVGIWSLLPALTLCNLARRTGSTYQQHQHHCGTELVPAWFGAVIHQCCVMSSLVLDQRFENGTWALFRVPNWW